MKVFILLALALIAFTSEIESVDGILQLSRRNFDQAISQHPRLLVKFYIDSCGYCKKMKPVFIQLADKLKDYGFVLGEVNAEESKALSAKQGVKAYPTLKLFRDGEAQDFPNSSDSIEMLYEFALQHSYGLVTQLKNQEEIDLFLKRSNIALLQYSTDDRGDLPNVAVQHLVVKFGQIVNSELQASYPHKYTLINKDLPQPQHYNGEQSGLSEWINLVGYPLVFTLNEEEFNRAETQKIPLIGLKAKKNDQLHKRINFIADSYKDKIRFIVIDPTQELCNRRFEYLIKETSIADKTLYYYDYQNKKTTKAVFEDDQVGTLKKVIGELVEEATKYQREEEKQARLFKGDGEVHVLTKDNFQEQVFENPRHVFAKFYAPWCGHCQNMAPAFKELAKSLNRDDIVIAEVDHTQNQIENVPIEGYPTLYLFKQDGDQKKRIEFNGDRSVSDMTAFLQQQLGGKQEQQTTTQTNVVNEGKVIQLTSDNFNDVVLNSSQDVLVKFFAPWCGHCKNMAQAYQDLAANLASNKNVLIAEMDWTAHKTSEVDVKGFPTLIFFKKGGEKPEQIKFERQRTAESMAQFIEENSSFAKREDL